MGDQLTAIGRNKYEDALLHLQGLKKDADDFYGKGNKSAGTRLRNGLQTAKGLLQDARTEVQQIKSKPTA